MNSVVRLIERAPVAAGDNADIAHWLRCWADGIESGRFGPMEAVVFVVQHEDGRIGRAATAREATDKFDTARAVGLLGLAAQDYGRAAPNLLSGE